MSNVKIPPAILDRIESLAFDVKIPQCECTPPDEPCVWHLSLERSMQNLVAAAMDPDDA